MLQQALNIVLAHWPLAALACIAGFLLYNKFYNGLHKYPGPALAAYTNWWRFFDAWNRTPEQTHIKLHEKYGEVVRIGPNILSFSDPKALKDIYGLNKGFTKSAFYPVQQATAKGQRIESLFSTRNEEYHAKYRRSVNNAFSMSSLVSYEPLVESTLELFLQQTQKVFAQTQETCNFSEWLQFFAFDVIGELTWSKRLGFIEHNRDVDGIVDYIARFLSYAGPIGQMPVLDLFWAKNPLGLLAEKYGLTNYVHPVTKFAITQSAERAGEMEKIRQEGLPTTEKPTEGARGVDLLTKFNAAAHAHPTFMTERQVLASCASMILAGSETTAISLSTIFYMLLKHPEVYSKLMTELDDAVRNGTIEDRDEGIVRFAEAQKLPYLDAVIQESFRIHPAAGLLLERTVPPQGATICGRFVPGGTIVGCNAWVLHRNREVFGADSDVFRPERWIEASAEKLKEMKSCMFQFGAGSRTCIGKNISLLEIYKMVPSFLRRFEIELESPDLQWRTFNGWFVRQLGFSTRFKARPSAATV